MVILASLVNLNLIRSIFKKVFLKQALVHNLTIIQSQLIKKNKKRIITCQPQMSIKASVYCSTRSLWQLQMLWANLIRFSVNKIQIIHRKEILLFLLQEIKETFQVWLIHFWNRQTSIQLYSNKIILYKLHGKIQNHKNFIKHLNMIVISLKCLPIQQRTSRFKIINY